jgi:hypothetical protein
VNIFPRDHANIARHCWPLTPASTNNPLSILVDGFYA